VAAIVIRIVALVIPEGVCSLLTPHYYLPSHSAGSPAMVGPVALPRPEATPRRTARLALGLHQNCHARKKKKR
jgi:hypothetical protein